MFTRLEEEKERQERRLGEEIFETPKISSIHDIRRVLVDLDPAKSVGRDIPITTEIIAPGEADQLMHYFVSAPTEAVSKRQMLLNGFAILKARNDLLKKAENEQTPILINNREMKSPVVSTVAAYSSIDPLIQRWLGGYRDGLLICWDLPEGKIAYDVFTHRLFKAKPNESQQT